MSLLQKGMSCAGSLKLPEDSLREMTAETGIVINLKKVYRLYRAEATDGSAVAGAQSHWAMDMIIQGSSIRGRLTAGQRRHCACPQTARVDIRRSAIAVGSSEVVVPVPFCWNAPEPEITPPKLKASDRLMAKMRLLVTLPVIDCERNRCGACAGLCIYWFGEARAPMLVLGWLR